MREMKIYNRMVGNGNPVYIIAEIGSNHGNDPAIVKELIDISAVSGFDAVKFQTYEPLEVFSGKITTKDVNFQSIYGERNWWEVARDDILMPREWFKEMFDYAKSKKIHAFSTVHSVKDAEFIMQFNPPAFKVASIDVSYTDFLGDLATFNRPIILSTGMHYLGEIEKAVSTITKKGNDDIALLHCVSCYPPDPKDVNLRNINMLCESFELPVGFSDHSPDNYLAIAAVALGALIIEKHVTLDRNMKGIDHSFSLDPKGMEDLVKGIRQVEQAMGNSSRRLSAAELDSRQMVRRSVTARIDLKKGESFSPKNLKLVRPGTGIHPKFLHQLIGRKAKLNIQKEETITWEMVE